MGASFLLPLKMQDVCDAHYVQLVDASGFSGADACT